MIDVSDQAQAFVTVRERRAGLGSASGAHVAAWLPDHLHVLRETVEAEIVPGYAAVPHLLVLTYLLCAEMFARQLVTVMPIGDRPAS